MRRPNRVLVLALSLPFVAGCFGNFAVPVPEPGRRSADIRGVVRGPEGEERIEFDTVDDVQWSESELTLTGIVDDEVVTRSFPISSLSGVLVRRLDPNKTSVVIAGFFLGAIATVALIVTGQGRAQQPPLPGG